MTFLLIPPTADVVWLADSNKFLKVVRSTSKAKEIEKLGKAISKLNDIISGERRVVAAGFKDSQWTNEVETMKQIGTHLVNIYECVGASWGCSCKGNHSISFQCRGVEEVCDNIVLTASSCKIENKQSQDAWKPVPLQIESEAHPAAGVITQPITDLCGLCRNASKMSMTALSNTQGIKSFQYTIRKSTNLAKFTSLAPISKCLGNTRARLPLSGTTSRQRSVFKTPQERAIMGARLLMAVLQQHAAPWFQPGWRTHDVFWRTETGCRPYFEASFKPPVTANGSDPDPKSFKPLFSKNVLLYNTGIAMVELAMDNCIEDLMTEEEKKKFTTDPGMACATAAARIVMDDEELRKHLMPDVYCEVTERCLKGDFKGGKDLKDDDLFSEVYREAVRPLMDWVNSRTK